MPSELDLLNIATMTSTVQEFEFNQYLLQSQMFSRKASLGGDTAEWDILAPDRKLGEFAARGAASKPVPLEAVKQKISQCAYFREHKPLDADFLQNIRGVGSRQQNARGLMAREQKALALRLSHLKEWACSQCLTGTLTINQEDVKLTVDYELPADNAVTATTDWLTATWANIEGDLEGVRQVIGETSGKVASTIIANHTVKEDLLVNSNLTSYFGTNNWREEITKTGAVTDFLGFKLMFYDLGYKTAGGTFTPFIADDVAYVLPALSDNDYCEMQVGTSLVNPDGATTSALVEMLGTYSRSEYTSDPSGVKIYVGDLFLPVLTIPGAIATIDTNGS